MLKLELRKDEYQIIKSFCLRRQQKKTAIFEVTVKNTLVTLKILEHLMIAKE